MQDLLRLHHRMFCCYLKRLDIRIVFVPTSIRHYNLRNVFPTCRCLVVSTKRGIFIFVEICKNNMFKHVLEFSCSVCRVERSRFGEHFGSSKIVPNRIGICPEALIGHFGRIKSH